MKAIMSGERKDLKCESIKHLHAPHYPNLSIEKILEFASNFAQLEEYFPEARDLPMLNRQVSITSAYFLTASIL